MEKSKWFKAVILCVGFFINTFVFAIPFAFGCFLNGILDKFNESLSMTAAVQSILTGVGLSSGVLAGTMITRFGLCKVAVVGSSLLSLGYILSFLATSIIHLYMCISFISGFGVSVLYIAGTTAVGRTFTGKNKLLIISLQNTGCSLGVAVLPYLFDELMEKFGLNGTYLLMGGFYLNFIPLSILFSGMDKTEIKNETCASKKSIILNSFAVFKDEMKSLSYNVKNVLTLTFSLTIFGIGITMGALNGYFALVLDLLKERGLSAKQALLTFPITYGVGIFARLLPGLVKQFKGVNCFVVPIVLSLGGVVGQILIIHVAAVSVILIGCGLSGLAISGVSSSMNILVIKTVNEEHIAVGLGLALTSIGVFSAVSSPTFGLIKDASESYDVVQYLTAGCQTIGILCFLVAMFKRSKTSREREQSIYVYENKEISNVAVIEHM